MISALDDPDVCRLDRTIHVAMKMLVFFYLPACVSSVFLGLVPLVVFRTALLLHVLITCYSTIVWGRALNRSSRARDVALRLMGNEKARGIWAGPR